MEYQIDNQQNPQNEEDEEKEMERELWLEHAPILYDVIITKSLIWPSLTVQFMPMILFVIQSISFKKFSLLFFQYFFNSLEIQNLL